MKNFLRERIMIKHFWLVMFPLSLSIVLLSPSGESEIIRIPFDYPTIQEGINASEEGDTVLITEGIYTGQGNRDITFNGKAIKVTSESGAEKTIIEPNGNEQEPYCGFIFNNGENENSVLDGFTIRKGARFGNPGGGGIEINSSSPSIENCIIENNKGGGIGVCSQGSVNASPLIANCQISGNDDWGGMAGGIACCASTAPYIVDCTISDNSGSGLHCYNSYSSPTIVNTRIMCNSANKGAGIHAIVHTFPTISNCLIISNSAAYAGGGIYFEHPLGPSVKIENCTISENSADYGGGIYCLECENSIEILNSILWDNSADHGSEIYMDRLDIISISYSDVYGGQQNIHICDNCTLQWGSGMINQDPLFSSGYWGSHYLSHIAAGQLMDSPCIDTGSELAKDIFYLSLNETIYMDEMTTRRDHVEDSGFVDIGYHCSINIPTRSPTPTGTWFSPTQTPTFPCISTGIKLEMPSHTFKTGDLCYLWMFVCNLNGDPMTQYPLFLILDVYGDYWFAPSWKSNQEGFDYYISNWPEGLTEFVVIDAFVWPGDIGEASGITFHAAFTDPQMTRILGETDSWTFGWE